MGRSKKKQETLKHLRSTKVYRAAAKKLEEIASKHKTMKVDGFMFYADPLDPKRLEIERLREKWVDHKMFSPYTGPKFLWWFSS